MDLISYLLPFILIIAVVTLIVIFMKRKGQKTSSTLQTKKVYLFIGGYTALLLLSVIVSLFIPIDNVKELPEREDIIQPPDLLKIAAEGRGVDGLDPYLVNKETFTYEKEQLQLIPVFDEVAGYGAATILVEEKPTDDDTIEVITYQTPTYIDRWEVTGHLDPIHVDLLEDRLKVENKKTEFVYASIQTAFPFRQFEKNNKGLFEEEIIHGQNLLYLRIPSDLALEADEALNMYYVKK